MLTNHIYFNDCNLNFKAIFIAFFIYTHVGIDEVLEKRNALTVMLGLKEAWNKIVDQRTETYYKAI